MKGWFLLSVTTVLLGFGANALSQSNDTLPTWAEIINKLFNHVSLSDFRGYKPMEHDSILIENDILMSPCEYLEKYQLDDTDKEIFVKKYGVSECTHIQDALYDINRRWKDNIVPYELDSLYDDNQKDEIKIAIQEWEDITCLTFVEHTSENDYIFFSATARGCSSHIGRRGGRQTLNLNKDDCVIYGTILHEIGHALGLYHEKSRPDRDQYVTVNYSNIKPGSEYNFKIISETYWDSQGAEYDFFSILHYPPYFFIKEAGKYSIEIYNKAAYERQGRPELGNQDCLSPRDILQINRMYNCPSKGYNGVLMVRIKEGVNLNTQNPFVKVLVVDAKGKEITLKSTKTINSNHAVREEFIFSPYSNWQLFRLSVWDSYYFKRSSTSRAYSLMGKNTMQMSQVRKFCASVACDRYVTYDYDLIPVREGGLKITVERVQSVPSDGGIPSPYVIVTAVEEDQQSTDKRTQIIHGTTDPVWNEVLQFDQCTSLGFFVQVWGDSISGSDTQLSQKEFVALVSPSETSKKLCFGHTCNFFLILSYEVISNPQCAPKCKLIVLIKTGKYLAKDKYINPFVVVDAYTHGGYHVQKKTAILIEAPNPHWYQELCFITKYWKEFEVTVMNHYSLNPSMDREVSDTQTWILPLKRSVQSTRSRIYAHSGYVDLEYECL